MKRQSRDQSKAQLMAEAEEAIDDLLDWGEEASAPTLAELEDVVLALRKRLGQRMGEMALRGQGTAQPVLGPSCPECGREMQLKGDKAATVESRLGALKLERAYYYCSRCRKGLFPPRQATPPMGEALECRAGQASGLVKRDHRVRAGGGDP